MASELALLLRNAVDDALPRLRRHDAPEAKAGGWSAKEELGHLIDSSINNHMRFVRAALDGRYEGETYEQNRWVDLNGYAGMEWSELVDAWLSRNRLLARVVERIPDERLEAPCIIGGDPPVTLRFVIEDYVRHMRHHVDHIVPL